MYPHHFPLRAFDRDVPEKAMMRPELATRRLGGPIVYRFYDANRQPIYIGYAACGYLRWSNHRRYSEWWPLAEYVAVSFYRTAADAVAAEKAAIANEKPRFNKVGMQSRAQIKLRLDRGAHAVAAEIHRVLPPEMVQELAELLSAPERLPVPTPPPPARFAHEEEA